MTTEDRPIRMRRGPLKGVRKSRAIKLASEISQAPDRVKSKGVGIPTAARISISAPNT
jgi:hypothetical protein